MPGTSVLDDIELIIEDIGGGGKPPARRDRGDSGGGGPRAPRRSSACKYAVAISVAMIAILMFFMAMIAAFLVLRRTSPRWVAFQLPVLLWFNTAVLLASSVTLETARKRQAASDEKGFKRFWTI